VERRSSELQLRLPSDVALHARPAAVFVRTAMGFDAEITVINGERQADAKSLMAVLALGATGGTELVVRALGDDASGAVEALAGCVAEFS
jgi:phosphotransferase system HPr (HPr) family protein